MPTHDLAPLIGSYQHLSVILLYAGPDQILPLMSVIGAIFGFLLIFWQRLVSALRRAANFFLSRLRPASKKKV